MVGRAPLLDGDDIGDMLLGLGSSKIDTNTRAICKQSDGSVVLEYLNSNSNIITLTTLTLAESAV